MPRLAKDAKNHVDADLRGGFRTSASRAVFASAWAAAASTM